MSGRIPRPFQERSWANGRPTNLEPVQQNRIVNIADNRGFRTVISLTVPREHPSCVKTFFRLSAEAVGPSGSLASNIFAGVAVVAPQFNRGASIIGPLAPGLTALSGAPEFLDNVTNWNQKQKEYRQKQSEPCPHNSENCTNGSGEARPEQLCGPCSVGTRDLKERISSLQDDVVRNAADTGRQGVGMATGIAGFFSPLAAAGLTIAGGILNIIVGVPICAVNAWKLRKNYQQRQSLESDFKKLDQSKKEGVYSILNFWRFKGNQERIKSAGIFTFIYGGIAGFGVWGIVSGSLAVVSVVGATLGIAGAVAGAVFAAAIIGWGVWALGQFIKKHYATKALQTELKDAFGQLDKLEEGLNWNRELSLEESRANAAIQSELRPIEKRIKTLSKKWLQASPENAAKYLLHVLFPRVEDHPLTEINLQNQIQLKDYLKELHDFNLMGKRQTKEEREKNFDDTLKEIRMLWMAGREKNAVRLFCKWQQFV